MGPCLHARQHAGASGRRLRIFALALAMPCALAAPALAQRSVPRGLDIPIEYHKLANGLKVVLSPDRTTPTAVVAVYYNIGFRNEPRDRTGFAHLFEHMMFQGSQNLGKGEFIKLIESSGGTLNGSTRFDFTNYYQTIPAHKLETVVWAEADRMRALQIDSARLKNQQDVVKNEVRLNVLNQPYGGFPWIDLPMAANTNWYNAHNFYGDLAHLDAATLDDVRGFFRTYYAPNNAVVVIVGDFESRNALTMVKKYFESIPAAPQPAKPDLTEPRQSAEKRASRTDSLARRPALALGYHVPERYTPEWYAFGLLDQILAQGRDSRFYDELVRKRALTSAVTAGINYGLGHMYNYNGPMLWIVSAFHDNDKPADSLIAGIDQAIASVRDKPVEREVLDRALVKLRSALYSTIEAASGLGRADLLASFALFDDDPGRINRLEVEFAKVTPELIQRTAQEYLRPTNRTIYTLVPAARATGMSSTKSGQGAGR